MDNTAGLDKNPMPGGAKGDTITVKLAAGEEHEFGDIEFAYPGVYNYTITEVDDGQEGYTYDTSVYTVTYTVTQNGTELNCVRTFQKDGVDVTIATFEFDNTYVDPDDSIIDDDTDDDEKDDSNNSKRSSSKGVATGDENAMMLWWLIMAIAVATLILIIIRRRQGENR